MYQIIEKISWDYKSGPSLTELVKILKPFKINIYEDPSCAGSDSFGYILSNQELTPDQLHIIGYEDEDCGY